MLKLRQKDGLVGEKRWLLPHFARLALWCLAAGGLLPGLQVGAQPLFPQSPSITVCGALTNDTVWSPALGTIIVCSNVTVPTNLTLTMQPGTVVRLTNGASILALAGSTIHLAGTPDNPVLLRPLSDTPNATWGAVSVQGQNSSLTLRHAEIWGGRVIISSNAVGLLEDSYFHDYGVYGDSFALASVLSEYAGLVTMRRCIVRENYETLWRYGLVHIEDSLFENIYGDGIDCDRVLPGSWIKRCTLRHGVAGNVDALDVGSGSLDPAVGGTTNLLIESCWVMDFPFDKGVSIGENSHGIVVSNCLFQGCDSGIALKDECTATIAQCTIVECNYGINLKARSPLLFQGGRATNTFNNIIWGNPVPILVTNDAVISVHHSDVQGTNWPGSGNLSADPFFVHSLDQDYSLRLDSPCRGAGTGGMDLGARLPVGAPMALSNPWIESYTRAGDENVLRFLADSGKTYSVQSREAVAVSPWTKVSDVAAGSLPRRVAVTNFTAGTTNRFYRLVTPQQP